MRVGMITRTIPPYGHGGIQTHVAELSAALAREGVDVHLFVMGEGLELDGVRIHPVKATPFPGISLGLYWTYTFNCAREVAGHELDVIHGHSMYSFGYSMRRDRIPYVATIHGTQLNELRHGLSSSLNMNHAITDTFTTYMEMYTTRVADRLIAVSDENKRDIVSQYGTDPAKVEVVPNGIVPERFKVSDCSSPTVISVGRLHERKRVDLLIDAFAEVVKRIPGARLKIVGTGSMEGKLRAQVRRLGLEDSVEMTGFVPDGDLPGHYRSASVFALPSAYEGFGIVLIEAMAAGLPCVSVRTGGAVEVIRDGWNGHLVEYDTMADALVKVLSDRKKRRRMGRNARKLVEEKYAWRKIARDVIRIYESVMRTGGPR